MGRTLNLETAKAIYRQAVDPHADDGEGATWWAEVRAEMAEVVAAPTIRQAAAIIAWWHGDWSMVGDTPSDAAKRIRDAARQK
ncbi:hypothetical protein [Cupriavidus campinensis]|uniref:Uncharacterized protein n=1 Tax=Cupriavidus campinensis TaxID=151783 RepID=A0ABY3EJ41_9BURK|nr:hypothetical protein [Cupriavidus campinensis]TSP10965.1 hypothetical protein FGG12_19060 [Cupriavidus campinensis]